MLKPFAPVLLWQIAYDEMNETYLIECKACKRITTWTKECAFDSNITVRDFLTGCGCHEQTSTV